MHFVNQKSFASFEWVKGLAHSLGIITFFRVKKAIPKSFIGCNSFNIRWIHIYSTAKWPPCDSWSNVVLGIVQLFLEVEKSTENRFSAMEVLHNSIPRDWASPLTWVFRTGIICTADAPGTLRVPQLGMSTNLCQILSCQLIHVKNYVVLPVKFVSTSSVTTVLSHSVTISSGRIEHARIQCQ